MYDAFIATQPEAQRSDGEAIANENKGRKKYQN